MANLPSVGGSPITFLDSFGAQYSIPLSFVTFPTATGAPVVSTWPGWTGTPGSAQLNNVTGWLAYLVGQSLLSAAVLPLPPAAFTIAARDVGSSGNDITISFGTVTPNAATPAATTVDVTVTTKQVYAGLTVASLATVLGTVALGGTQPGLAFVSTPLATMPTATAATNFTGTPLVFDIPGSSGVLSPTHDAAAEAADAALLQAAISDVNAAASTFTLTLSWTKSQTAVPLSSLATTFAYLITITPPTGGFVYGPAAGSSVTLAGGTDPATIAPNPAQATIAPG
jgi:hypothetical protein